MSRSQPSTNLYSVEVVIPTFEDPSDDALVSEFHSFFCLILYLLYKGPYERWW